MHCRTNLHSIPLMALLLILILGGLFSGCSDVIEYKPNRPDSMVFDWSREVVYASSSGDEKEAGTIFASQAKLKLEQNPDKTWDVNREPLIFENQGYHKNARPEELEMQISLDWKADSNLIPSKITGYDSLHRVLEKIEQRAEWKRELLGDIDTASYKTALQDRWRLFSMFLPSGEFLPMQELQVEEINTELETIQLDSARLLRPLTETDGRSCLEFVVYAHTMDSLPKLVEQYVGSDMSRYRFAKYDYSKSLVETTWKIALDTETGFPCRSARYDESQIELVHPTSQRKKVLRVYGHQQDYFLP